MLENWEFVDKVPTSEEVVALLDSLDPVWGVPFREIAPWVQGLPSKKKTDVTVNGRKEQRWHEVTTLYVAVAGRVQQARLAAEDNGWRVDFEPEPATPTGAPGFLQMDDRIVYREYVTIWTKDGELLGRKCGMAWVPASGGKQAAGSNPYEKVETSARGRALAAWGFGVLPGSGIASLEEMQSVNRGPVERIETELAKKTPEERAEELMLLIEKVRQARDKNQEQMFTEVAEYAEKSFGVDMAIDKAEDGAVLSIDVTLLKPGQQTLLGSALAQTLKSIAKDTPL